MTSLFRARRRAEEFHAALEDPARAARPDAASDGQLPALVGVATALRELPEVSPREEFAADLRARLMLEATDVLAAGERLALPVRRTGRERRLVAAASAALVLGGGAGVATAAQQALPGDPLYPVKRGLEWAEAGLSAGPSAKGRDLVAQAEQRLVEAEELLARDDPRAAAQVPGAVTDFSAQAREGAELLLGSYRDGGDPADVETVRRFAADGVAALQELARTAPPEVQDELVAAAVLLQEIDATAAGLCATCAAELPALLLPGVFLTAAEVDRALSGLDAADLDNSHPVVLPRQPGQDGPAGDGAGGSGLPGADAPGVPGAGVPGDGLAPGSGVEDEVGKAADGAEGAAGKAAEDAEDAEDTVKKTKKKVEDAVPSVPPVPDPVGTLLPDPPVDVPDSGDLLP